MNGGFVESHAPPVRNTECPLSLRVRPKVAVPVSAIGFQRSNATCLVLLLADEGRKRRRLWDTQSMIRRPKIAVRGMWGGRLVPSAR
jgi:hypothetical protein